MTRNMFAALAALVLVLFVGACENTNPNDTDTDDTDTTPELFEAAFSATLNTYGWEGDEVVLLDSTELDKTIHGNGASYLATCEGETTVSGTTPDVLELNAGVWNASYFYGDYTIPYVGTATADISESSDLGATLCADLSGDWSCDNGLSPTPYETEDAVMNGCTIQLEGIAELEIDGNKVSDVGPDGTIINGIISSDSIRMIVDLWDGSTIEAVCTPM